MRIRGAAPRPPPLPRRPVPVGAPAASAGRGPRAPAAAGPAPAAAAWEPRRGFLSPREREFAGRGSSGGHGPPREGLIAVG